MRADNWTVRVPLVQISREGLRIRSTLTGHIGGRLRVSFDAGTGAPVVAIAEVIWSNPGPRAATGLRVVEVLEGEDAFEKLIAGDEA